MDKEKSCELQTMIDDARSDCSRAFDYIRRLHGSLAAAREYASMAEKRLSSAIGTCVDTCNELGKESPMKTDNTRIRKLMANIKKGITKYEAEFKGLQGVKQGLLVLFDIASIKNNLLCEKLIADLDRMQIGMDDAIAQLKRDFKELKKELDTETAHE